MLPLPHSIPYFNLTLLTRSTSLACSLLLITSIFLSFSDIFLAPCVRPSVPGMFSGFLSVFFITF